MVEMDGQLAALGLAAPDQIGFVVRDLDQAIARYTPIFGRFDKVVFPENLASFHGAPPSQFDLRFAFGYVGGLEIELIEWVSGDTPHREFLERGRDGMHHLRFRTEDLDAQAAKLTAAGYDTVWHARISPEVAYGYYERSGDPLIVELLQMPEAN
ncbi:MAG: VOC family protein [Novosphingobium sp.]